MQDPIRRAPDWFLPADGTSAVPTLDPASNYAMLLRPDGTVLAADEALASRLGLAHGDLVGRCIFDLFAPGVAALRRAVAEDVVRLGLARSYQDRSSSGHVLDVLVQPVLGEGGAAQALAVFVCDVTGHWKLAHDRLRLSAALEQAVEAVILIENDFTIGYVNQAFEAMTGYPHSEVRGRPVTMLYQGPIQQAAYAEIRAALDEGDAWSGRTFHTVKDGRMIRVEKTVSPIRGRGGVVLGFVSVWRDVTRVAELERQLRQAQKMEAIATLAGGIAHDFNNILGPIILHAELGLARLPEGDPVRSGLGEILGAAHRAGALVGQILSLSRRSEAEEPSVFGLADILRECEKFLRPSLPATIDIVLDLRTPDDAVLADPTQVHQVVINLATNAAYAMRRAGGTLTLALEAADRGAPCRAMFPDAQMERAVLLTVRDTGEGIPPERLERIFDPFFTTRQRGGTGLGLTVVHGIVVERLGGAVHVRSSPGAGAAFHVLLPRHEGRRSEARADGAQAPGGGGELVLLVEDEAPLRQGTAMVLQRLGYRVRACAGPEEALESFGPAGEGFALVLADVTMPGMTGTDLLRRLRQRRPDIPAVLVSGYSEIVTPELLRELGADYLRKPFTIRGLGVALQRALGRSRGRGQGGGHG